MKQADLGLSLTTKRTRKREFLAQMERVVPWAALVDLVAPHAPEGKKGRPLFPVQTMLRIHFMQQWFTLSDPAMEEALHDIALFREFAGLGWDSWIGGRLTLAPVVLVMNAISPSATQIGARRETKKLQNSSLSRTVPQQQSPRGSTSTVGPGV